MLVYKEFTWILKKYSSKPALLFAEEKERGCCECLIDYTHAIYLLQRSFAEKFSQNLARKKHKEEICCLSLVWGWFFFCYTEEFRKEDCRDFLTDGDLFYTSAFWEDIVALLDVPIETASHSCIQRICQRMIYHGRLWGYFGSLQEAKEEWSDTNPAISVNGEHI